jgi:DNA repair protein RecN (Recombination protein N)
MLLELRVENLLLIDRARLDLTPGLNVLTGETGAGKTILAHALDLLLGGRPRAGIVRPGAAEAYVEGSFELGDDLRERLGDALAQDAQELVLARRVGADGRTRAYLNGRTVNVGDLRDVARELVTFYGQHEHRKLALASAQLDVLDGFCGPEQMARRALCAQAHARVQALEAEVEELERLAGARDRELDLLEFELAEIDALDPDEREEAELAAERERLRHAESLRGAALAAAAALGGGADDQPDATGASTLVAHAVGALEGVAGVDAELDELAERCRALALETDDAARELARQAEGLEADPARLEAVEERRAALDRLKRKHGGTLAAVLAHAEACRARRDELAHAEVSLADATERLEQARGEHAGVVKAMSAARGKAAPRLAAEVRARLEELAMPGASFDVALEQREHSGPAGAEAVELLIAPNPGVPAGPLREIASGGELSRVMLALMSVAGEGNGATLVFDEVDAGIGGHTARVVGERLAKLAAGRQVLCITHLPQVASLADRHFSIAKDTRSTTASAQVTQLSRGDVVSELVRMLGADDTDRAARRHAEQLLKAA